ncbi:Uncharacterised protein [Candidatus Tiddalikarchaeum anstoanum]|nr:Uncharacterised protein [Candidatus Tiddalikarchaeum anstoanum]
MEKLHLVLITIFLILIGGCTTTQTYSLEEQTPVLYISDISNALTEIAYNYNMCGDPSNTPLNCGSDPETWNPYSGTSPYTFTIAGLPPGLTMRLDGLIYGKVPDGSRLGVYNINICVTDSAAARSCYDNNITVEKGCTPTKWTGIVDIPLDQEFYGICTPDIAGMEGLQDTDTQRMTNEKCMLTFQYELEINFNLDMKMDLHDYYSGETILSECHEGNGTFTSVTNLVVAGKSCDSGYESYSSQYFLSPREETNGAIYFNGGALTSYFTDLYADTETFRTAFFEAPPLAKATCNDEFGAFIRVSKTIVLETDDCTYQADLSQINCPCSISGLGFDPQIGTCEFYRETPHE